jgi:hypothetical protein
VLGLSLFAAALIVSVAVAWFAAWFAVRACWRWIKTQLTVRCAMKGFDRNLQRILPPHPSEPGNGHFPPDNETEST